MLWTSRCANGTVTARFIGQGSMNKSFALLTALVAATAAGCAYEPTCDYSDAPYMSAQSVPPLRAPEGLAAPDRSASLVIPPPAAGAPAMPTGESRCLDRPPS